MHTPPTLPTGSTSPSPQEDNDRECFVFLDQRGKRWPRFKRVGFLASLLLFLCSILFVQALILPSDLRLPPVVNQLKSRLKALQEQNHGEPQSKPLWLDYAKNSKQKEKIRKMSHKHAATLNKKKKHYHAVAHTKTPSPALGKEIRLGFYEGWDPNSLDSLKEHAAHLTHFCPDWLNLPDSTGTIKVSTDQAAFDIASNHNLQIMPLLRNLGGDADSWNNESVEWLLNDTSAHQQAFIDQLITILDNIDADGVVIDWQQVDPADRNQMTTFITTMALALHKDNLELWLCIPVGSDLKVFDLDKLAHHVDHFVAQLHDEHSDSDAPGPIASQAFFKGWMSTLVDNYGKPQQWIISQGTYGYDWAQGEPNATTISFVDAMSRADHTDQKSCAFTPTESNPHFVYDDGQTVHNVWFMDAITFLNELSLARSHRVGGVAISRLGTEDPDIWDVLEMDTSRPLTTQNIQQLQDLQYNDQIANIGEGNLITVSDEHSAGVRHITENTKAPRGQQFGEIYQTFPKTLTIMHQGRGPDDAVTLTFDDGPSDEWTPKILDILKQYGVKATFFMIGANMEKYPDIVRRVQREGHMIGVHTYTHPNIAQVSDERAHLELNATQRLLQSITGHGTILFRPPYNADTNPHDADELVPIKIAQSMGYVSVTEDIDTEDWDKPGVDIIVNRVKTDRQMGGNVILCHDAGGDRHQTVEALPKIIEYIRNRGDRWLSLPELTGIPAESIMPPVETSSQHSWTRFISGSGFTFIHQITNFFWAFMIVATLLTIVKTLVTCWLAIHDRRQEADEETSFTPPVSVLIAAYNEAKVIMATLQTVLRSTYAGEMEIIVVDDGSKDETSAIVRDMASQDARIRLIQQTNHGKAVALRTGLAAVRNDIVVTLDADTQFTPTTIHYLVQPLADPKVAAVSGRARVGNAKTLFARFQSLEYSCGFNLDRRAYHQLNCITVVPGAVCSLRASMVREAGGISNDTLAEDTDLTLALHRQGARICYSARAVAWTEAPETMRTFAKQRFRWAFGTLQCLWKYRDMLFNTRYRWLGWFSLPCNWFFNIFLVAMGSVIDLILIISLLMSPANLILYFYFCVFLIADLLLAAVACRVEREPLAQVWLVLPMRFIYRPVLNWVVIKSILRALKGVWVGWGKLDRTASVNKHLLSKGNNQ